MSAVWPPTGGASLTAAAESDAAWAGRRAEAATPQPASDASRAQTPAPVRAADKEVAELLRRAVDELPPSPSATPGGPRLASPLGFRAPPPGFSPSACASLPELGATSFDEDTETEAVFRRARDALLLQRARLPPAPAAAVGDGDELSEWSTDDGGVTWVKSVRAQRRAAAVAGRRTPRQQTRAHAAGPPHRPLSPVREPPASQLRAALRSVLVPLAVYFIVVGVWHHLKPLLPEDVLERLL